MTGCELYGKFWEQYGRALKLGAIEDTTNRNRIAKLLRFHTSKSLDKLTSFEEYIGRMKEGQKDIYFLAGACGAAWLWWWGGGRGHAGMRSGAQGPPRLHPRADAPAPLSSVQARARRRLARARLWSSCSRRATR